MPTADPTDPTRRIAEVWAETLTLNQGPETTLRRLCVPDSSGVYGRASDSRPATVRRVRPGAAGAAGIDYRLEEEIGRGGMGEVHRAWQESVGRRVALKLVRADRDAGPLAEERFRAEGAVTGALEHPGIVPVYDLGEDEHGRAFLAMKLVEGRPWSAALRELPLADNVAILLRVAEAVAFAHARGVIHADLKPANVMLGAWGEVLLLDWGLALRYGPDGARPLTPGSPIGGTPAYMAPEQAVQDLAAISPATDIYLLGATLYELIGGRRPHAGDSPRSCLLAAARNELAPIVGDAELLVIAQRAMATAPADRHPSAAAFIAELRAWRTHVDSATLLARARDLAARDDLAACADALRAVAEARVLWPGNPAAAVCEGEVRRRWAQGALRAGDAGLAASAARPDEPAETALHAEAVALATTQRRQARRLRALRVGVAALVLIVLAGLVIGERHIAGAAAVARTAQSEAETAREVARAEAYVAQLARALAALAGGDRAAAEAALAACPAERRGIEWRVLATRCAETPAALPGTGVPVFCVAWAGDGTLWYGTAEAVVQVVPGEGRELRRQLLPAPATALACSPAGILVGTRQGCVLLGAAGMQAAPGAAAVSRVALAADGACLWISEGRAWRWRPGEATAAMLAEAAVDVAWQDGSAVVATAQAVQVDATTVFTATDGEILAVRWDAGRRLVLLRRGPAIDAGGNLVPSRTPAPGAPAKPVYEVRAIGGEVLVQACRYYLNRDPAIMPDGTLAVVHGRYHGALLHLPGGAVRRAVLGERLHALAGGPDGALAVAWQGGVGVLPAAAPPGELLIEEEVPIAAACSGGRMVRLDCWGGLRQRGGGVDRILPHGRQHLSHQAQPWRVQALEDGGALVQPPSGAALLDAQGMLQPLTEEAGERPLRVLCAPDGGRYVELLPEHRYRLGEAERDGVPLGWLDRSGLLLAEGEDLVARTVDGWNERWRLDGWQHGVSRFHLAMLGGRALLARDRLIEVRDPADGRRLAVLDHHRHDVVAMVAAGSRLVTGDRTGHLAFWDAGDLRLLLFVPWTPLGITALAGAPDRLAVGSDERLLHLWEDVP